jgi:predicted nuclease of restriction endonuclease-like (RecB) superfamily
MNSLDHEQIQFITEIKEKVRVAQYEALKAVNELQKEFPSMGGFSATNLWYMVQFYNEYFPDANLQPLVGEISWTKHLIILSKCKESQERWIYCKELPAIN